MVSPVNWNAVQSLMASPINLRDYSRTPAQRGWGPGWPSCGAAKAAGTAIVTADRSGTRMSWHKRIARLADALMDETERRGYLLIPGQCGAYVCRAIGGTNSPSLHSWGLAGDLNWLKNPMKRPFTSDMPKWVVELWNRYGFAWGGHYSGTPDPMHMEFMGTPAQADEQTALALRELTGQPAPTEKDDDMPSAQDIARAVWEHPVTNAWGQRVPAAVVLTAHEGITANTRAKVEALQQALAALHAEVAALKNSGGPGS